MVGKNSGEALGNFIWGAGGTKLTPEQIAIRRIANQKRLSGGVDTSPVQHWTQGAARVADALADVVEQRRITAAQDENNTYNTGLVNSILGGGADASAPTGSPSTGAVAAVDPASLNVDPSIRDGIITTAQSLGIDPIDLGTAISYETAGTFDPVKTGPTTQWGQHRGLIQFGEPQAKEYGVDWSNPVGSQLGENGAVANYLRKAGVEPGMGMLDIYSAINAGRVGRYNASDANNGGAPGSVRDKVEQQMGGHRAKALALLGSSQPAQASSPDMGSVEQALGAPFVPSMSPPDPAAQAQQQELMTQVVGSPTAFRDPMVNAQRAQAAIDAQMTPQMNAQPMAPELPPPTTIANSPAVAQVAQAMTSAPQQQGSGVNQALIRALSDPRANDQTRAIAEILIRQDQARQQAAQEQAVWQQRQEYERQQQANDPLRRLQLEEAQIKVGQLRNPSPEFRQVSGDTARSMGLDPAKVYNVERNGKVTAIGGDGVTVNNNMGGNKFDEKFAELDAKALSDTAAAGTAAQRNIGRIDQLGALLEASPSGAEAALKQAAGEYGINTDGLSNIQAAQALINSLVPEQRQPGSGPMSDADLALFKQSLPRLINQPGGNATIINTIRAIAQYDAEGANIVQRTRLPQDQGGITRAQAFEMLQTRPNPLSGFKAPAAGQEDQGWSKVQTDVPGVTIRRKN